MPLLASLLGITICSCLDIVRSECPLDGHYQDHHQTGLPGCPGLVLCEPGFYCQDWVKAPCTAGTFGSTFGLESPECSGVCPAGFACGPAAAVPKACGSVQVYCPEGSTQPVPVSPGYYSVSLAGDDPTTRTSERVCEKGTYCQDGQRHPCPGGTYGDSQGMVESTCSGKCPPGFYCPIGSTRPTTYVCDDERFYCPEGSMRPIPVDEGYVALKDDSETLLELSSGFVTQQKCPLGHFCIESMKTPCAGGTFGDTEGLLNSTCSGMCEPGYFCPAGSTNARAHRCGLNHVCPRGSAEPTQVSAGSFIIGEDDSTQVYPCPLGSYCSQGQVFDCPRGRFGNETGLTSAQCSGPCQAGFYCPRGSKSATQVDRLH